MDWQAAERVQKNEKGEFRALIGGEWVPVARAQKSGDGKFRVMMSGETGTTGAETAAPAGPPTNLRGEPVAEPSFGEQAFGQLANLATGASGLMRGGANLISPGLGESIWPKSIGSGDSGLKTVGQVLDPVGFAVGGGVAKVAPYVPMLGRGMAEGVKALARNLGSGATAGGIIGGLSEDGSVAGGAALGAAANVVLPPAVQATTKAAGRAWDLLVGRYGKVRAAQIANAAAGGDKLAIRAAALAAPDDLTATQATAGVKNDVWDALGELAKRNDTTSYYSRLLERQKQERIDTLKQIAGGANQTEARVAREATKANLNAITTPMRETELAAANEAGRLLPGLQGQADRLGTAASSKVEDVRRMTQLGATAEDLANSGAMRLGRDMIPPAPGLPRVPGRYGYGTELAQRAEGIAQKSADDSLILGEGRRFAQMMADSMERYGLKPLDARGVVGGLQAKLNDPAVGTNENTKRALGKVIEQIDEWQQRGGGQLDAEALYGIRKNLNSTIESLLGTGDPKAIKATAAGIAAKVKPLIDDAIEQAGGTAWKNYLKTFEGGMRQIEQKQMGAEALKMLENNPDKFVSLTRGNEPKAVEKVFGPGAYNIETAMGRKKYGVLDRAAGALERDKSIAEGAARGQGGLEGVLREHSLDFILPNWIDREVALFNRVLRGIETKLNKSTVDALYAGMKTGKSAAAMMSEVPTGEKMILLRELAPYMQAGAVSGSQ